jgi:predicted Zn-dependent protease
VRESGAQKPTVAAVMVLCVAAVASAQSRRALADLGRLDPPAYAAPLIRDNAAPVFDEAIEAYGARQYERAANLLRRFVTQEPDDPAGNFFLAASLMMTDEVGEAEDRLGIVLAANAPPFEMPARFVLAKARIRVGDLAGAERQLSTVKQTDNPYARPAAELLEKIRALGKKSKK